MAVTTPQFVRIVEVGPRDGLQNISEWIPTATKLNLINRLELSGLRTIELTSVVSHRAVPQMADATQLLQDAHVQKLLANSNFRLPVLVPNLRGLDIARAHGVKEIAVFISATEGFSQANINCTCAEAVRRVGKVVAEARRFGIAVRGYISCIFADPYDGPTKPSSVLGRVQDLLDMGCYEVSLGDTLGTGNPTAVRGLLEYLQHHGIPMTRIAGHFHDTYKKALANSWAAYECGVRTFDTSVGGLGGCPFVPEAGGNLATERLVASFENAGVTTGIKQEALEETAAWVRNALIASSTTY
ncbi:hydroxymethylglutaryl-CoA lyase mitochondrial [Penicillium cf. viridicatum]|uniref:hydroxymethylglutaryl-CoA lyase n=1 Tax=Penicillium cf. viridicatum TaxID=2972119 RepID=A0A9W9MA85_9EURO|nr:hydroxymethylglutaryl-CoA lyase mitochondrial [Penicillium cf. viridicatum]